MIDMRVKELFFDRPGVMHALSGGNHKALLQVGAFVRRTARRLLRKKGGRGRASSQPGEPPHRHTDLLRDHVYFHADLHEQSVVIGPALMQISRGEDGRPIAGMTVPEVLEQGGAISVREYQGAAGAWRRARTRVPAGAITRVRQATIEPRPYMGPALEEEARNDKLALHWRDVVR